MSSDPHYENYLSTYRIAQRDSSVVRKIFDEISTGLTNFPKKKLSVLDIGTGNGLLTASVYDLLESYQPTLEFFCVERSSFLNPASTLGTRNYRFAHVDAFEDAEVIPQAFGYNEDEFSPDVVFMLNVLTYSDNPFSALTSSLANLRKPSSFALITSAKFASEKGIAGLAIAIEKTMADAFKSAGHLAPAKQISERSQSRSDHDIDRLIDENLKYCPHEKFKLAMVAHLPAPSAEMWDQFVNTLDRPVALRLVEHDVTGAIRMRALVEQTLSFQFQEIPSVFHAPLVETMKRYVAPVGVEAFHSEYVGALVPQRKMPPHLKQSLSRAANSISRLSYS